MGKEKDGTTDQTRLRCTTLKKVEPSFEIVDSDLGETDKRGGLGPSVSPAPNPCRNRN